MTRPYTKIYFDGGCRPNPGAMECAVVVRGQAVIARDLGHGSSMDAEWLALLRAVEAARALGGAAVLLGDSVAVVQQANAALAADPARLTGHAGAFVAAVADLGPVRVRHIKRTQNLAGIALDWAQYGAGR